MTVVAYVWVMAGLIDALAGIVRLVRGSSGNVTKPEAVLITVGALAATLTPLILWVRQLARGWGNSVRALQLADGMRRVMTMSIAASGVGALTVRLIEVIVREQAIDVLREVRAIRGQRVRRFLRFLLRLERTNRPCPSPSRSPPRYRRRSQPAPPAVLIALAAMTPLRSSAPTTPRRPAGPSGDAGASE